VDNHLHTLGYLLGAVVIAVGFLSTRIHSNLDSTIREVGERSRAVRQALNEGESLGPADLAELLGVVRSPRDYVAQGSRLLNWAIFATSAAILADALYLAWHDGADGPEHALLVLTLLFLVTFAAVVFSEFELQRVSIERRREISATTLGRLHELARLMAANKLGGARAELNLLRETFPTWGLLIEIEAYLDLRGGQPAQGLEQIEFLVKGDSELHLSPVVGAACCLELGGLDSALDLLARIEQRGGSEGHPLLRRAVAVSAGHLPALLAEREQPRESVPEEPPARNMAQRLLGDAIERRREPVRNLGFALDPAKLPQTAPLMATLERWEGNSELEDFESVPMLFALLELILGPDTPQPPAAVLLQARAEGCRNPLTLESFGFATLACGEPRTALGFFERAIHMAPAAGRSHWGRAIACSRVGWRDAASASLRRAETLTDETPLLSLTQRLFEAPHTAIDPVDVEGIYPHGFDDMDRFELALLGVDIPPSGASPIQARFAAGLIAHALASSSTTAAVAA
jgi:hypothetical protein